jgi:hypothetical protein
MLSERLWCLLDALVDGQRPFEQIYAECVARSPSARPDDLRTDLAYLQAVGLVSMGEFSAPPAEAESTSASPAPPSTWIEITPQGAAEWDDTRYEPYWKESTPPLAEPFTFPLRVQYGIAGLCLLLAVVAVWGFLQASWSIASDRVVDLGPCLRPIRATLATAGAPAAILTQLDQAGQAGIWRSEAVARLKQVDAALNSMPANAVVAGAQADVERLINACWPDSVCQCGALGR